MGVCVDPAPPLSPCSGGATGGLVRSLACRRGAHAGRCGGAFAGHCARAAARRAGSKCATSRRAALALAAACGSEVAGSNNKVAGGNGKVACGTGKFAGGTGKVAVGTV